MRRRGSAGTWEHFLLLQQQSSTSAQCSSSKNGDLHRLTGLPASGSLVKSNFTLRSGDLRKKSAKFLGLRALNCHTHTVVTNTNATTRSAIATGTPRLCQTTNDQRRNFPHPDANSLARCAAFTTALISVTRNFPSSSSMMPSMVQPAGVVTASLSSAG